MSSERTQRQVAHATDRPIIGGMEGTAAPARRIRSLIDGSRPARIVNDVTPA